jgi:(2Fe-2S) ferredoxin
MQSQGTVTLKSRMYGALNAETLRRILKEHIEKGRQSANGLPRRCRISRNLKK